MQNAITELVFILDRSGSMAGMEKDTIGGFNAMIEKQKKLGGKVFISTVLFSSNQKVLHDRLTLDEIKPLNDDDYTVGGTTALLDAIGRSIHHISNIHKYARKNDVPTKTMFVITTDGYENASTEYSFKKIKQMIKEKEEKGWEFIYLASNIDVIASSEELGIKKERAIKYVATEETVHMFDELAESICSFRQNEKFDDDYAKNFEKNLKQRQKK